MVPIEETDNNGDFRLEGLDPKMHYCLAAGGSGLCSVRATDVEPGSSFVVVEVFPVYGARMHFVGDDGQPAGLCKLAIPALSDGVFIKQGGIRLDPRLPGPAIAGMPAPSSSDEQILLIYLDSLQGVDSVAFSFVASFPGFHTINLPLQASPLASGGIPSYDIQLTPSVHGFGAVDLELSGFAAECNCSGTRFGGSAALSLNSEGDSADSTIRYRIDTMANGHVRIEGVPFGVYVASLQAKVGFADSRAFHLEGSRLVIGPGTAQVKVDASTLGGVAMSVLLEDGTSFDGPVLALLSKPSNQDEEWISGGTIAFASPPYVVCGVRPGTYFLSLLSPLGNAIPAASADIEVRPGGMTSAVFELR